MSSTDIAVSAPVRTTIHMGAGEFSMSISRKGGLGGNLRDTEKVGLRRIEERSLKYLARDLCAIHGIVSRDEMEARMKNKPKKGGGRKCRSPRKTHKTTEA